jgi:hypothetical protein
MDGDITAQIERSCYGSKEYLKVADRQWLWVKPTGGDAKTRELLAKWWPEWAKSDAELTDQDIASHNLFVFGGPDLNQFAARIAADLPVKFGKGQFAIGKRVYREPTNCLKLLHPNPLSPARYVLVYAFNDAAAFAEHDFFGTRQESAWGFRSGDAVVLGIPSRAPKWGVEVAAPQFESDVYILNSNWQPPDETPLGELEKPFGYSELLRLRADAIREATGADAGIISAHTPAWRRWNTRLPAGPVTLHDLATVDMFPEYVTLCDASGRDLAGMLKRASASTALSDLKPDNTYQVAMGYEDLPAFRVEPPKLPKVISFRTPEEFLAIGNTALPVRNMRQTPIEVAEAVASYIKKRGKVAPRPECFSLADYIQNPEANEFGACDWLHLGAGVAWKHPQTGKPLRYRYTLSLGLRAAEDPGLAPPRGNSKSFVELDLAAKGPTRFEFASLDKKLAATVSAVAKPIAVANGKAILLDVRLANQGQRDLACTVALAPWEMQRIEGFTWPSPQDKAAPAPYHTGFRVAIGPYQKPTLHENAALLLFDGPAPKMGKLVARNAGYNFGLVGIHHALSVKANSAASLPLLFLAADAPDKGTPIDLPGLIDGLKGELMAR